MRVKDSITRFIENALYLKVNKEKPVVSYVRAVKYLGYSFYVMHGKCALTVHSQSNAKMQPGSNDMKGALMSVADKLLLRKGAIVETVNDELKNIAQVEHSRHRSVKPHEMRY